MKSAVLLLVVSILSFSCNNKKKSSSVNNHTIVNTDTSTTVRPEQSINLYAPVDVSPMDMSYFPADYPKLKMNNSTIASPVARLLYSRPHLQGRKLFHDVIKYGDIWRLGANEASELTLYKDVTIQDKRIKAGRYILYCIPQHEKWTIVLNSNIDIWGLQPDVSKDIARFVIPVSETSNSFEFFTMIFQQTPTGAHLLMAWDNVEARLPFTF